MVWTRHEKVNGLNRCDWGNEFHPHEKNGVTMSDDCGMSGNLKNCPPSPRILLVIDKSRDFVDLENRLHPLGYRTTGPADGEADIIEVVAALQPDMVLLDIALDSEGGAPAAFDRIRNSSGIPVVFITDGSEEEQHILAGISGTFGYILKPFRDLELKTAIEIALARARKNIPGPRLKKERKRLESDRHASQKMEALGTLAGGIAHDFSNIIGAIIGYTQLSLLDVPADSHHRENMERVLQAGKRAKELIKQIWIFSQRADRELRPVNVLPLIKEVVRFLRSTIPATIEIRQGWHTQNTTVLADPTEIYQLLINLCTNAANAMRDRGGTLTINLSEEAIQNEAPSSVSPHAAPRPYLVITISDTGHGMDPDTLSRIFEPYFTTKAHGEGAGMGLAVVHGIVNSYGGYMEVKSESGVGADFYVHLPLFANGYAGIQLAPSSSVRKPIRVMFVDGEETLVNLGERMLSRLGYKALGVTSCLEALTTFRADPHAFDVIIADQTMPQMTGLEMAEEMLGVRPDIPIILFTGLTREVSLEQAQQAGIKRLMLKPLVLQELAETLRSVLNED